MNKYFRKEWAIRYRVEYLHCNPWEAVRWEYLFPSSLPFLCRIGRWHMMRDFNTEEEAEAYVRLKIKEEEDLISGIDSSAPRIRKVPPFKYGNLH